MKKVSIQIIIFLMVLFGFSGCVDLNDFQKITKQIEWELSTPVYESSYYIDTLVKERAPFLQTSPRGIYYLATASNPTTYSFTTFPFLYNIVFDDIKVGPYYLFSARNAIQTDLFNQGYSSRILDEYPVIQQQDNSGAILRQINVHQGTMMLTLSNTFLQEAIVSVVFNGITNNGGVALTKQYVLSPQSSRTETINLAGHVVRLDQGSIGYNQLFVSAEFYIFSPSSQGNTNLSVISSSSEVNISFSMSIVAATEIHGAVPGYSFHSRDVEIPLSVQIPSFLQQDGLKLVAPIATLNVSSKVPVPIDITLNSLRSTFVSGRETVIPIKTATGSYELPLPAGTATSPGTGSIVADEQLVDEELLRQSLFDPSIAGIAANTRLTIAPVKTTINDKLVPSEIDYQLALFMPFRVEVNDYLVQAVDNEPSNSLIEELNKIITNDDQKKISRVVLAFTVENYTPFDVDFQFYLFRNGVLTDSLIDINSSSSVIAGKSVGNPIDLNGFPVKVAVEPSTFTVDIEKDRWDRLRRATSTLLTTRINSVKSNKIDYVFVTRDQYVKVQIKIRKIIYSTKVF